jgi:hypothetical protein
VDHPLQLSLDVEAFPTPTADDVTFVFTGPGRNLSEPASVVFGTVNCWSGDVAYRATCNIIVNTVTASTAGYYTAVIGNGVGTDCLQFDFLVKYSEIYLAHFYPYFVY